MEKINEKIQILKDKIKGGHSGPEIITFDYQYAPNAQRARNLLNLTGIPYTICEQPFGQPRPILKNLGITYRRVPVNAIGKDVYVDKSHTSLQMPLCLASLNVGAFIVGRMFKTTRHCEYDIGESSKKLYRST